jgi:hypothetical protein
MWFFGLISKIWSCEAMGNDFNGHVFLIFSKKILSEDVTLVPPSATI